MSAVVRERPTSVSACQLIDPKEDIINFASTSFNIENLNEVENTALNEAYAKLSPEQLIAARLESSGITDRSVLGKHAGVEPITITIWRRNPYYRGVVKVNTFILEKINRTFREKQVKQILMPIYSELIKRVNDPTILSILPIKELRDIITSMHRELRLEQMIPIKDELGDGNELEILQKRRNKLLQADRFEDLVDENIIQLSAT